MNTVLTIRFDSMLAQAQVGLTLAIVYDGNAIGSRVYEDVVKWSRNRSCASAMTAYSDLAESTLQRSVNCCC